MNYELSVTRTSIYKKKRIKRATEQRVNKRRSKNGKSDQFSVVINASVYYDHHVRLTRFCISLERIEYFFIRICGVLCHSCYNVCRSLPNCGVGGCRKDVLWSSNLASLGSWEYSNAVLSWKSKVIFLYEVCHCAAAIYPFIGNSLYTW